MENYEGVVKVLEFRKSDKLNSHFNKRYQNAFPKNNNRFFIFGKNSKATSKSKSRKHSRQPVKLKLPETNTNYVTDYYDGNQKVDYVEKEINLEHNYHSEALYTKNYFNNNRYSTKQQINKNKRKYYNRQKPEEETKM